MKSPGTGLPTGIVTFVFTDVEGSTRLLRRLGDRYPDVLDRHQALMRKAWVAHDGHEVSSAGDSVFLAFAEEAAAVEACAEAQRLLAAEEWPAATAVRVRMGVHSGLAAPRGHDYVALAVHQAARVMSAAHGGQVLLSGDTASRLHPLDGLDLVALGRYRLRDFEEPVALFTVRGRAMARDFPAVRALPADGHNLVAPPTSFHGRDDDLDEVVRLAGPARLVTLAGPGGAGKTRLATEAGLRIAPQWPDGVWLVDLAPLHDASQLGSAIGAAVGAPRSAGDREADVVEHLGPRRALVVLDGCEHLVRACTAVVQAILAACPGCGVIATSREPLGLPSESVWRVGPLALPNTPVTTAEAAATSPAVQLFLERARAVRRDLVFDDEVAPTVVEICRRLDGLPLALELAAARLAVLSPVEVLDGLSDRFRLLRTRNPTMPERQRTMKALLEWNDRLLDDEEATCLRRLGVFGAGFSLHAATAAVADHTVAADDVAELVWSLVDKSLVVADLTANDTRYRLLESVREFAARRLAQRGETEAVADRLATWYLERIGPHLRHARGWTGATGVELDNLRALVPLVARTAPERAQELAFVIGRHLDAVQSFREGIAELTRHVAELPEPSPARISLLTSLSDLHLRVADVAAAERVLAAAVELRDRIGSVPTWDDVAVERTRGDLACRCGDNGAAVDAARRALAGDLTLRGQARMWNQLGIASVGLGDLGTAETAFARELETYRRLDDEVFQASAEGNLAEIALRRGDVGTAARHQQACLGLALELGAPAMVAFSMIIAARIAAARNDWATAAALHAHAESILHASGLALYDDDRRLSDEMLGEARRRLGDDRYAAATSSPTLGLAEAAAMADTVLTAGARS